MPFSKDFFNSGETLVAGESCNNLVVLVSAFTDFFLTFKPDEGSFDDFFCVGVSIGSRYGPDPKSSDGIGSSGHRQ